MTHRNLMAETERLIMGMVRDSQKKRQITIDGKTKTVPVDIPERARAVEVALKFLALKNKVDPEDPAESDYERQLKDYHNVPDDTRSGGSAGRKTNGAGGDYTDSAD